RLNQVELLDYEPHVAGIAGIHVPQTGIIDYPFMANKLKEIITTTFGAEISFNEEVLTITPYGQDCIVETNHASYNARKVISCTGLQSDRIASLTDNENDLRIIPFRGEYYKLRPEKEYL